MSASTTDRRVKYTVMVLKQSLIELMQKEHISKISVKAICELADVNRSTFYAHFKDPYDLLLTIKQELLDKIRKDLSQHDFNQKSPISFQVLYRILEYVKENADVCKALLSENCSSDFSMEVMEITEIFSNQLFGGMDSRTQEYLSVFGTSGCVSILQMWLQDNTPEPTSEIAEIILQAITKGITSFHLSSK